jgi:hypothetical protein
MAVELFFYFFNCPAFKGGAIEKIKKSGNVQPDP